MKPYTALLQRSRQTCVQLYIAERADTSTYVRSRMPFTCTVAIVFDIAEAFIICWQLFVKKNTIQDLDAC